MAALSGSLAYFAYTFFEPILAERLTDFSLTSMQIGLFFAIYPVFYIPGTLLVQFTPKAIEKRLTLMTAVFLTAIGMIFVGPSSLLGLDDSLLSMAIGTGFIAFMNAYMIIPSLPEMVESMVPLYPGQERRVNDLASGVFNSMLGIG